MADDNKTDPGWYRKKPRTTEEEWEWDGDEWTGRHRPPRMPKPENSPAFLVWLGVLIGVVGAIFLGVLAASLEDSSWLPLPLSLLTLLTTLVMLFGIISAGVRHGSRWADFDRQQRGAD